YACFVFFFQAEDGIRDATVTGVQTCALPICILTHKLPWALVLLGVFITVAIELMGVQALQVAVGVYLPISTSSAMFAGGVVRWRSEERRVGKECRAGQWEGPWRINVK